MSGYRVGRVWLIFKIPEHAHKDLFPDVIIPGHLAYVEWFSPFTQPDRIHGMYKVSPSYVGNQDRSLRVDVVEVKSIRRSCHLIPVCGSTIPRDWTSSTVLNLSKNFYVNTFSDLHMYMTLC